VRGLEKELFTTQSVRDFLVCTGRDERICQEVKARMVVISQGKVFPETDILFVMESSALADAFRTWVAGLHAAPEPVQARFHVNYQTAEYFAIW
jgi:hypothetical protein